MMIVFSTEISTNLSYITREAPTLNFAYTALQGDGFFEELLISSHFHTFIPILQ